MKKTFEKLVERQQESISQLRDDKRRQLNLDTSRKNSQEKIMKDFKNPQLLTDNLSIEKPTGLTLETFGNWDEIMEPKFEWVSQQTNENNCYFNWEWVQNPTKIPQIIGAPKPAIRALTMSLTGNNKEETLCTQVALTHVASWKPSHTTSPFPFRSFKCGFYYGNDNPHYNAFCWISGITPEYQKGNHSYFNAYLSLDVYSIVNEKQTEHLYAIDSQIAEGYSGNNNVDNFGNAKPWYWELDNLFISPSIGVSTHKKIVFVSSLILETMVIGGGISYIHFNKGTPESRTDLVDPLHVLPIIQVTV